MGVFIEVLICTGRGFAKDRHSESELILLLFSYTNNLEAGGARAHFSRLFK